MKHYIYISLLTVALSACGNSDKKSSPIQTESIEPNEISVSQVQFKNEQMQLGTLDTVPFKQSVKTTGTIDVPPQNKASISAFISGYINKTPLLIGDKVTKGQLLVTLENPEFIELQQQYLEIAEQLNYLKSEYNRQQTLYKENITSEKNFLKAESTYKSSLAHYNGLKKKLSMLNINPAQVEKGEIVSTINLYAPIDGYVTKVNVSNGMFVAPSDVIMEIVDNDHIHLELSVFEKDILNIKKGQKIHFQIPEASNNIFDAEVYLVGTSIDEKTRIVKVHGHILNEDDYNFIVGMFIEADIVTDTTTNMALPNDAVLEIDNAYYALVSTKKDANTYYFEKVKLNIGEQTETHTTIQNPESLIDKDILTKGGFMLLSEGE
ncbi:efflux RND transporter periplasmic adaptor subunit [Flavobacteriaceae bacterium XHP0103]|uniref:efflux RND transporter periplasmic adaptor subunit n=1 Tax=Marixanthotalea marina TaxID=2844359 RepID=UPI002989F192|nr:efflux RND transporter periplasmic adaptor subunit [Marixanthotalea marina]MBU3822168.1 efflux RND transporter periplasmic adaptor subunit [Marixanthotalea marina]